MLRATDRKMISETVWRRVGTLLALAVMAMPMLCATPSAAADNVYPIWGDQDVFIGPLLTQLDRVGLTEEDFTVFRSSSGNVASVSQFGEANHVLLWQIGLDELARVVQLGIKNVVLSLQHGGEHQLLIGQLGNENRAFTWQEQQMTAVVVLQLGDGNAVSVRPGVGLRIHVMQLGR